MEYNVGEGFSGGAFGSWSGYPSGVISTTATPAERLGAWPPAQRRTGRYALCPAHAVCRQRQVLHCQRHVEHEPVALSVIFSPALNPDLPSSAQATMVTGACTMASIAGLRSSLCLTMSAILALVPASRTTMKTPALAIGPRWSPSRGLQDRVQGLVTDRCGLKLAYASSLFNGSHYFHNCPWPLLSGFRGIKAPNRYNTRKLTLCLSWRFVSRTIQTNRRPASLQKVLPHSQQELELKIISLPSA